MAHHLTLVTARHARQAQAVDIVKRVGRVIRNTLVVIGILFVTLFIVFLATGPHSSAETPTPTTTTTTTNTTPAQTFPAPTTGTGTMDVLNDGSIRVTGDCIPDEDDFFWPCADVNSDNVFHQRDLNGDGKITGDIEMGA